ncbi:hypothetical protein [Litchfieldella xinjiangensis]|uniref:hypothetical protein n=1 Tax=Litchfieldella xinjiangensis TaxID=1166948 RepID=UPI0005BA4694|nr:hypothetical protein [Halomonas xinjiangensis]
MSEHRYVVKSVVVDINACRRVYVCVDTQTGRIVGNRFADIQQAEVYAVRLNTSAVEAVPTL